MATVQKTALKRYNGTDWDPVYLANSADITYLGTGFTVEAGTGFTIGQNIPASDSLLSITQAIVNNLAAVDKVKLPALADGSGITSIDSAKLTGTISRANLPTDVSGKGLTVATEEAKDAITADEVNIGDLVKVTEGKIYLVNSIAADGTIGYMELTDSASEILWSRITGTPTTLTGYGITDAVNSSEKVTEATVANKGKILTINENGKLTASITGDATTLGGNAPAYYAKDADLTAAKTRITTAEGNITTLQTEIKAIDAGWIKSGTIDIARLPASSIERLYVVQAEADLENLTTTQVQNGDTVKVNSTGSMYFVADDTKLGTADYKNALVQYTAGIASSVDWSGIQNKPTTITGYGITDAVNSSEKVTEATVANKGKILTINENGKLTASITGDATTLGGNAPAYYAKDADLTALDTAVQGNTTKITALETTVGDATAGLVKSVADNTEAIGSEVKAGTLKYDVAKLKTGEAIIALAASKLTGTVARANLPVDISGKVISKATINEAYTSLTTANAFIGDLVKLADGKVYVITDTANLGNENGYTKIVDVGGSVVSWSQLTDVPTTLASMNWPDAVTTALLTDTATVANAGKLLKISADGKLTASITGDATTLGGNAPAYYAKDADLTAAKTRITTAEGNITTLQTEIKAIDAGWISTGTISVDRLPHGALERCYVVATDEARMALTENDVQNGDTVKVTNTGVMYFVIDSTKLGTAAAFEVYSAGTAAAVDWSGVQSKPTTLTGYGITDAIAASEKVSVASAANAGKLLVLNGAGKLDVDITGHVDWANINNAPKSTAAAIDAAVEAATHTNRAVLNQLNVDADGHLTYGGAAVAFKSELDQVALGSLSITESLPTNASAGQMVLEAI